MYSYSTVFKEFIGFLIYQEACGVHAICWVSHIKRFAERMKIISDERKSCEINRSQVSPSHDSAKKMKESSNLDVGSRYFSWR